jgi:aminopeptidase N
MNARWLAPALSTPLLLLLFFSAPLGAQRLPPTATPDHYDLAFVVDIAGKRFEGTETIRVRIDQPTNRIVLNAAEIDFEEVTIGAGAGAQRANVSLDKAAETATLSVANALPAGPSEIHIRYSGVLNGQLRGFYIAKGENRNYAVTQFESTDARRAFPSFDEPAYKATFAVTLTIDRGDVAISNGRVISDTPGPGPGQHTVKFSTSPKMSSYLVAMAVGDFECLEGAADGTPIRLCTPPGKKERGRLALEYAQEILTFYNAYYTIKYPFGKLDMLAVPEFAAGAMENTAAIFYRENALLADSATASMATRKDIAATVAHEVAHQWFGNLVTMQWWDDLWLNEGFATWMETRPLAASKPDWNLAVDEARASRAAIDTDSLRSTHALRTPVRTPAEIEELFDAITYQKGAAVVRMIEHYVGAGPFRDGVNAYLQAHAYGNATSEDFWKTIAAASGKPVDQILPTFINQPGVPVIGVSQLTCTGKGQTRATFSQERFLLAAPAAPAATAVWQVPACLKAGASDSSACLVISEPRLTLDVAQGCVPWVFANAGAEGYYRTAYAPDMLRALAPHVGDALTAPERLTLIVDEWALVGANRHTAGDYLTLAAGYGREPVSGVLGDVTGRLGFIHEYLTTDQTRGRFETFVRTLLRPLFGQLGFSPAMSSPGSPGLPGPPGDNENRRALRAVVLTALGTIANDSDVVRQARAALDRSLAGGPALDRTLRESVVRIAAQHGDERLFDALTAAAARAKSPDERSLYLLASTDFRDPRIIDRALQRTLTSDVRAQEAARYLASFFDNRVARPRAWSFLKSYWSALEPKLRANGAATVVRALDAFCDGAARDDIRAFFDTHRVPRVGSLNPTIERINTCIDLREKQTRPVSDWLASRR